MIVPPGIVTAVFVIFMPPFKNTVETVLVLVLLVALEVTVLYINVNTTVSSESLVGDGCSNLRPFRVTCPRAASARALPPTAAPVAGRATAALASNLHR